MEADQIKRINVFVNSPDFDELVSFLNKRIESLQKELETSVEWDRVTRIQGRIMELRYLTSLKERVKRDTQWLKKTK